MNDTSDETRTATATAPPPGSGTPPTAVGTATPPPPGSRIPAWVIAVIVVLVIALAATGIILWRRADASDRRAKQAAERLDQLRRNNALDAGKAPDQATQPVQVTTSATTEPAVEPPAASSGLPYEPGPNETGTNEAYVRTMTVKDGYVYVTVDYVIIGEGPDGWFITNENPKLRTFPIAKDAPCRYLKEGSSDLSSPLSPGAFFAKWEASPAKQMVRHNPYRVTVDKGVVTILENEWLP